MNTAVNTTSLVLQLGAFISVAIGVMHLNEKTCHYLALVVLWHYWGC